MGLKAESKTVYELLNDKMYIIPPNQRKYVWEKENWMEMFDDINLVYYEKTTSHFIGSIVLKEEPEERGIRNNFSVIDGQQRISTLTILICAIGYIFAEKNDRFNYYGLEKHLFVRDKGNKPHPIISELANPAISKLVLLIFNEEENRFVFPNEILPIDDFVKQNKIQKKVADCFKFFYENLKQESCDDIAYLEKIREIIDNIRYINIVAENDEDAYTIFEILNARGKELTNFELLRNFLLKYSSDNQKDRTKNKLKSIEELVPDHIEIFLKHYVIHRYTLKNDKMKKYPYKIIVENEKAKGDVSELVDDLYKKASYYRKMIEYENCSKTEFKIFSFFKPRREQQFRPLILGLMHQKELGVLSENDYEQYLEFLYVFFICYHIIGETKSNKIEDIVQKYSQILENDFKREHLIELQNSMKERLPGRNIFYNNIRKIAYSHKKKAYNQKRENIWAVFEVLERELGYSHEFDRENFNIEHCLPDDGSDERSSIGNLILLEKKLNEKSGNLPIESKLSYYQKSSLNIPRMIAGENPTTDSFDINKRTEEIAGKLYDYISKLSL